MKKLSKIFIATLFTILLIGSSSLQAQSYSAAVGARFGGTTGITVKGFTSPTVALEGILGGFPGGPSVTLLGEQHFFLNDFMAFYLGGGGHARFARDWYRERDCYPLYGCVTYENGERALGVDAVFGLEAKIPALPLAFSLDVKPFVEWTNRSRRYAGYDIGLGAKVAF